jgi:outer membrane immunogenic protein
MRKILFATAAALAMMTRGHCADAYPAPYATPSPIPYGYSWMGPYLGANLGYQWGQLSNSAADPSGIAGGVQGGYGWQIGRLVFGAETDFQLSSSNAVFANYKFFNPWFGTLRGRGGFALNNILFYGTLGLAYGRGHIDLGGQGEDNLHMGWTAGGGMEVGLTPRWSIKAEYLYIDLASEGYVLTGAANGLQSSLMRFGVNYRF